MTSRTTRSTLSTRAALAGLLALGLASTGCLNDFANGNTIIGPTIGRQLLDLEQARKRELISQEEYETLRQQIIESGPLPNGALPKGRDGKSSSEEPDTD